MRRTRLESWLHRFEWLAGFALLLATGMASAERLHKYTVAIDSGLTTLNVRACFDGAAPSALVAESLDAVLALVDIRVEGNRKSIQPGGSVSLKSVPENGCVVYQADVSRPIKQHDRTGGKIQRVGKDLLTSAGIWLWRPETLAADEDIEISFILPEGMAVSTPWRPVTRTNGSVAYRIGHSPYDWPASVAFGRFSERILNVSGARLRLAVLDGTPAADVGQIQAWIEDSARMVVQLFGRFPQSQAQILVVPGARGPEPTPWAYVIRGGAPAAHFFINQQRPIADFFGDWTAIHELSHLLLPFVNAEDVWLSEGLATYYQSVLRARDGRMKAAEAWRQLHAGFSRGRESADGMTLAQATENMYRFGTYMRVYWEGAAIMLMADVRLRELTAGRQSLDTALAALNECCNAPDRAWSARELFARLDELTGTGVFEEILDQHESSVRFPDLSGTYRALGLATGSDSIEFVNRDDAKHLREAIMGLRSPAAGGPIAQ